MTLLAMVLTAAGLGLTVIQAWRLGGVAARAADRLKRPKP